MSVRPYEANIKEPATHNDHDQSPPDVTYELEHIYGYRCEDSRQNLCYNSDGNVVYMTAAVGVVLEPGSNSQKFFGSGQCDNTSKQTSSTKSMHSDDITALGWSKDKTKIVTG